MIGSKVSLALGALLVVLFITSSSADCSECQGDNLINMARVYSEKEKCWFSKSHHHLIKFKLELLNSVSELLTNLINSTNEKAPADCKIQTIEIEECLEEDSDLKAACHLRNMRSLVQSYNALEKCCNEVLDVEQLKLVFILMQGQIRGLHEIHKEC